MEKYMSIMENLKDYKELDITSSEKTLLKDLEDLLNLDRVSKMVAERFRNNTSINRLLSEIDDKLIDYIDEVRAIKSGKVINFESIDELNKKIDRLNEFKSKILNFVQPVVQYNKKDIQRIVDTCSMTLDNGKYSSTRYFGEKLIEGNSINEEVVSAVYTVLSDEKLMNEMSKGVEIGEKIRKINDVLDVYNEAFELKDLVFNNCEDIFLYNEIRRKIAELNEDIEKHDSKNYDVMIMANKAKLSGLRRSGIKSFIHGNKIEKLELENEKYSRKNKLKNSWLVNRRELVEKLEEVKKRLTANGLGTIILKIEAKNSSFVKEEEMPLSLEAVLPSFDFYEDIEFYYEKLKREYNGNLGNLRELELRKEKYDDSVSLEAVEMINHFYDTSKNIVDLGKAPKKSDISPAFALVALMAITCMNNTGVEDMNISYEENMRINEFFEDNFEDKIADFEDKFIDIVYRKSANYK